MKPTWIFTIGIKGTGKMIETFFNAMQWFILDVILNPILVVIYAINFIPLYFLTRKTQKDKS